MLYWSPVLHVADYALLRKSLEKSGKTPALTMLIAKAYSGRVSSASLRVHGGRVQGGVHCLESNRAIWQDMDSMRCAGTAVLESAPK